jgi:hypothetical protein
MEKEPESDSATLTDSESSRETVDAEDNEESSSEELSEAIVRLGRTTWLQLAAIVAYNYLRGMRPRDCFREMKRLLRSLNPELRTI